MKFFCAFTIGISLTLQFPLQSLAVCEHKAEEVKEWKKNCDLAESGTTITTPLALASLAQIGINPFGALIGLFAGGGNIKAVQHLCHIRDEKINNYNNCISNCYEANKILTLQLQESFVSLTKKYLDDGYEYEELASNVEFDDDKQAIISSLLQEYTNKCF